MLVIGSQALRAWDIPVTRKSQDVDIIATFDEYNDFAKKYVRQKGAVVKPTNHKHMVVMLPPANGKTHIYDFEIAWPGTAAEKLLQVDIGASFKDGMYYAHPGVVLGLKLSHRYLKNSPHFRKTMDDIIMLREYGYNVPYFMTGDWMKQREKETYTYSHPSLERNKMQFFSGDNVPYVYEHDDIHHAVAIDDKPAFTQFQADGADVKVSKEKFFSLPYEVQLNSVLEESYVLALERCLIPNKFVHAPRHAFMLALEKVCTSITSGWWREFAWENYYQAIGRYNVSFRDKFLDAVERSEIRLYQGPK